MKGKTYVLEKPEKKRAEGETTQRRGPQRMRSFTAKNHLYGRVRKGNEYREMGIKRGMKEGTGFKESE